MPPTPCLLKNTTTRPVELHMHTGLVVLGPGMTHQIDGADAYCDALLRKGVLSSHALPEAKPAKKARTPAKKPRKKASGIPKAKPAKAKKPAKPARPKPKARASKQPETNTPGGPK